MEGVGIRIERNSPNGMGRAARRRCVRSSVPPSTVAEIQSATGSQHCDLLSISTMLLLKQRLSLPVLPSATRPLASRAECLAAWQHHLQCSRKQQQRVQRRWATHPSGATAKAAVAAEPAAASGTVAAAAPAVQTFDYTALAAATVELQAWVPAKVEAVVQQENGAALRLRTLADSGGCPNAGLSSYPGPRPILLAPAGHLPHALISAHDAFMLASLAA